MHCQKPATFSLPSAFALAICLSFACTTKEGVDPGADGGKSPAAGTPCAVDAECRVVGLRCDPERRICVCTSDASCPGTLQCDPFSGRCVEEAVGCEDDAECGAGRWCDAFSRSCRVERGFCEPCDQPGDCGAGNGCLPDPAGGRNFCGAACSSNADCPRPGTSCNAGGQCEPAPGRDCASVAACVPDTGDACTLDRDCDSSQRCAAGVCIARRSGCSPGERCDPGDGVCFVPCDADGDGDDDCGANERCEERTCHGGQSCGGRVCVPLEPCGVDADCPRPLVCRLEPGDTGGRCVAGCDTDESCPVGSVCTVYDGRRVCDAGCNDPGDCLPDQLCEGGTCVGGDGRCQTSDVCGPCETCGPGGRCATALGGLEPGANFCAACSDSSPDACGPGGLCFQGRCAPACPADGCPRGFACEVVTDPGGAVFAVCFPHDPICVTECL